MNVHLDVNNKRITNVHDPQTGTDAVNKNYFEKFQMQPSHNSNVFKYLMENIGEYTSVYNRFVMKKIYHQILAVFTAIIVKSLIWILRKIVKAGMIFKSKYNVPD